jgi:hypothetical protein
MRIFEFADANEQLALWKLISDSVWEAIASQADSERKTKQRQTIATKKASPRKSTKKPKTVALPKPPKPPKKQQVTPKSAQPLTQQKLAQKTQKPQVLPKVFSNTQKSNLATPQTPVTSNSINSPRNAIKTRSERVTHDPNSVANIQRQLDPLASSDVVKRLTT